MPSITTAENDYQAALEETRLEESLIDLPEEDLGEKQSGNKSILSRVGSRAKKAGGAFDAAKKAVATGQYAVWQAMWDALVPSFGLSLLLVYVPIFSWLAKKTFPDAAQKLPDPGEDGMIGFVPPPDPATAKFVKPFYGMVNMITMFSLALLLTPILLIIFIAILAPPVLALHVLRTVLGPVGEILARIFGVI